MRRRGSQQRKIVLSWSGGRHRCRICVLTGARTEQDGRTSLGGGARFPVETARIGLEIPVAWASKRSLSVFL